jgi:hypothetical protein
LVVQFYACPLACAHATELERGKERRANKELRRGLEGGQSMRRGQEEEEEEEERERLFLR